MGCCCCNSKFRSHDLNDQLFVYESKVTLHILCQFSFLFLHSGIAVGLFHECSHDEISKVALECKADIIVVENELLLKKVLLIQHKLPDLRAIVQLMGDPPLSDKRRLHKSHQVSQQLSYLSLTTLSSHPNETF